jgi:hypothetical protein
MTCSVPPFLSIPRTATQAGCDCSSQLTFVRAARTKVQPPAVSGAGNLSLSLGHLQASLVLDGRTKKEHCSGYVLNVGAGAMLKTFVEEAAALASIVLFVGMVAVWAQLIPQL